MENNHEIMNKSTRYHDSVRPWLTCHTYILLTFTFNKLYESHQKTIPNNTMIPSQSSSAAKPLRTTNPRSLVNSSVQRRQQESAVRALQRGMHDTSRPLLAQIATHARGIRRPGCPCCDPDSASTVVDQFLSQT